VKTHELARALEVLASVLRTGPDVGLSEIFAIGSGPLPQSTDQIAVNLSTLSALSRVDRQQWLALIREYQFPIEFRPRDASRDILGKLLRFLERSPDARERLRKRTASSSQSGSPELLKALQTLLRD